MLNIPGPWCKVWPLCGLLFTKTLDWTAPGKDAHKKNEYDIVISMLRCAVCINVLICASGCSFWSMGQPFDDSTQCLTTRRPGGIVIPGLRTFDRLTVSCSLRCQRDQIHQQPPVCHMTIVQHCLPVLLWLLFPRSLRECRAEWVHTTVACLPFTPRNRVAVRGSVGRGETHAIVSPGPTLPQDHAHEGEIGGGQFYGWCDVWWLQRRPSRRLRSAAEIPVQQTGVPGTVAGRSRVLGGSHCETDPHSEGDEAAAVVHRLRRVSNLYASILSCTAHSILWKWARPCWTAEITLQGANTSRLSLWPLPISLQNDSLHYSIKHHSFIWGC